MSKAGVTSISLGTFQKFDVALNDESCLLESVNPPSLFLS